MVDKKQNIKVLGFEKANIPSPREFLTNDKDRLVNYGTNNLYPAFLLHLYGSSPIHSAIINAKATYLIGDGLKDGGKDVSIKVNEQESFEEFVRKCVLDYLIFNAFAVEVVYNSFGEPIEYYWVPVQNVRTNQNKSYFWYNEDWKTTTKGTRFDRFGTEGEDSKIFYFDGYFPNPNKVYPVPDYAGCITSISTDIAIRDFNLNNIKNQFSVSTLITFFNGSNIPNEVKREIEKDLRQSYSGENGKKLIIDYQNPNGKSADVRNISPGDWDKAYEAIGKNVADDIYRGHQVTSPMLFGVKTEGQLGGATELETAYEIFKNTYIRGKRNELEGAINYLFGTQLSFTDKPLFSSKISDSLKQQVFTVNEIREEAGKEPRADGDRYIGEPVKTSIQAEKQTEWVKYGPSEEDFDKVAHLGTDKSQFEVVSEKLEFDTQSDVAKWLLDNDVKRINIKDLKTRLAGDGISVTIPELKTIVKQLQDSGVVKANISDKGNITITPATVKDNSGVQILYDYIKRPEVSGSTIIPTSRGFCKRLVENNKYYSREDIQAMSALFGYSVWDHCGGWWFNPVTGETQNHCRHEWKIVTVRRKGGNNG